MISAGIYVRISQDRGGAGLGVQRQEDDCRSLCERKGWQVADVYADNDVSAYSGAPRPAWQRLLADVRDGAIGAVATWHVDRLTRTPRELEDVIDLADRYGLDLATVSGEIDLATPTGRMIARMLGAAARHESEHKAERQRRQRRQAAEAGRVAGGGTRPYGYDDDRVTVVDAEAAIIREAAARALAGESLSSVCRDLERRDVRTPKGNYWQPRTLRRLLAAARISGRREHTPRAKHNGTRPLVGEIVADMAEWPAIITPTDSDRIRAMLTAPERQRYNGATGRTYLLSGVLRCHRCGTGMVGRPRSGVPRYVCPNMPGGNSCGSTATNAARTDEHVRDLLLAALDSPELRERLAKRHDDEPELRSELRAAESKLEELAAAWAADDITRAEWQAARGIAEKRVEKLRARLTNRTGTTALERFLGTLAEMADQWEHMNVSQRRAVVASVFERVWVHPANPRRKWDPDRFEPVWSF